MRLWLERFGFGKDSTLGRLSLVEDGKEPRPLCFTVEDERRKTKVPGETCIPKGVYRIEYRTEGGLHAKYKARFPAMHRGMLWLQNVPGFTWVYVHVGNTDDDTDGCPLVVETPVVDPGGEFRGAGSERAYKALYLMVTNAIEAGEEVVLSITDRDEAA